MVYLDNLQEKVKKSNKTMFQEIYRKYAALIRAMDKAQARLDSYYEN